MRAIKEGEKGSCLQFLFLPAFRSLILPIDEYLTRFQTMFHFYNP